MERLVEGPINSCFHGEHLDVDYFLNNQLHTFEEEEGEAEPTYSNISLNGNMPFLQMLLQTVEAPPFFPLSEPSFQTLLRLQHLKNKPWTNNDNVTAEEAKENEKTTQIQAVELESCVTQDVMEELPRPAAPGSQERRKRKRQRPAKNKEEVESQRMTHIAVERNRRRQMNDHLTALRSLMPTSYIQRGDQASIIGGAIDFVKELEQLLYSLEDQRRTRVGDEGNKSDSDGAAIAPSEAEGRAEKKSSAADIEVTVIQEHVNMKVECRRRSGQLVRAIVGLEEELRLTVLHLNITAYPSHHTVLYSFNLKMEEECGVRSAEEIASAVQQMFSVINHNEIED